MKKGNKEQEIKKDKKKQLKGNIKQKTGANETRKRTFSPNKEHEKKLKGEVRKEERRMRT